MPGIWPHKSGRILKKHLPNSHHVKRDIYNTRARIRKEELQGYTAFGAMIKIMDEKGMAYCVKWEDEAETIPVGIIFITNQGMVLTSHF